MVKFGKQYRELQIQEYKSPMVNIIKVKEIKKEKRMQKKKILGLNWELL